MYLVIMPGWRWCRRYRRGRVGRLPAPVRITSTPITEKLEPIPKSSKEPVYMEIAEVEALRLIDLEKLSFEEAGIRMNVSRNTVWRMVKSAREKLVKAIIEGREIIIRKE
ncbi:MAG: DUF134 domain-containing protein [Candidatus Nezhaarchaeales archaeon]